MAGANNKSAKKYGYTAKQMETVRQGGGILSLAGLMQREAPARPTKAYQAHVEKHGQPVRGGGIRKSDVQKIRAAKASGSPPVTWAQKAAAAKMSPEPRSKKERLAGQEARRNPVAFGRTPKVTWADKAKASGQKKAAAFDVAALMKRDRSAAPAAPKVTWGQKAAAAKSKGGTVTIAEAAKQINNSGMDGKQRLAAKKQLRKRIDRMLANDRRARAAQ